MQIEMDIQREEWRVDERNIELRYLVSRGKFDKLYRAVYHNGDESIDVAVKVFDWGEESKETAEIASSRKGFERKISVWYNLEHPNIAKMMGAIYNKACHCGEIQRLESKGLLMMEYFPRALTLKSHVNERGKMKLELDDVIKFALGLARGLNYLHSKKIMHRDVRLENIFLEEQGNVKLANFKVARFEHDSNQDDHLKIESNFYGNRFWFETSTGSNYFFSEDALNRQKTEDVLRRLGYMAPEVRKKIPYDHKCDVYSFGLCLWELYCCDDPFPSLNYYHRNTACIYEYPRPTIPKSCPKSLATIMVKCWESDPKGRPEMKEVVRMLEDIDVSRFKRLTLDDPLSLLSCLWRG